MKKIKLKKGQKFKHKGKDKEIKRGITFFTNDSFNETTFIITKNNSKSKKK